MTSAAHGAGRRRRGRELALRVLFEIEGTTKDPAETIAYQAVELGATADITAFAGEIVNGCVERLDAVDSAIGEALDNWALVDLGKVERAVLRLGTWELLFSSTTPVAVVIDESIELARAYAGDEAAHFANGVLGQIARERV